MAHFNPFTDDVFHEEPSFDNARVELSDYSILNDEARGHNEQTFTLQNDLDTIDARTDQDQTQSTMRLSSESDDVIIKQPSREEQQPLRRQVPVYTIGWSSTSQSQFLATSGLDFLFGISELDILQTVVNFNPKSASKRYLIKVPHGETLYLALENSTSLQRTLFGSQRSFFMTLSDPTQQEAAYFIRKLGCSLNCCFGLLQELHIEIQDSMRRRYIGKVSLNFSFSDISFSVFDEDKQLLYTILAPRGSCAWSMPIEATFPICSANVAARIGEIKRKWDNMAGDYILNIAFPAPGVDTNHKMLLIGATILIEYLYYENRSTRCVRIC